MKTYYAADVENIHELFDCSPYNKGAFICD